MSDKKKILRMMLAALTCSAGLALAQPNEPKGKVVLQCAGMISVYDMVIHDECRVVLDFDSTATRPFGSRVPRRAL
jgi:hypothetical protein